VKKGFLLFLSLSFLMIVPLSAQTKKEVLLKFSKQEGLMRIVLEAEDSFINNSKINTSPLKINISFPEPFTISAQKELPFKITSKDKLLVINLPEESEIKFFRLSSPARLVFDIQENKISSEIKPVSILSKVFVIDAGHGGYDFGITSGDLSEKDISLSLAKGLSSILSKRGKKVFLTRKVDQYMSIAERINFINQKSPDIFISLHNSMSENFIVYIGKLEEQAVNEIANFYRLSSRQKKYIEKSKALSDSIKKAIGDEFKLDVISREMPLPLLNSVSAPSVLIELPSPKFLVYDKQTKSRLENSIIDGIALYDQ
jgi:N-acetylmuramoyl-L-alanine amidase